MLCRTIIQCVAQIENVSPQHHGQQRVNNITLINIERAYANSVVNNDMDRIIDIFGLAKNYPYAYGQSGNKSVNFQPVVKNGGKLIKIHENL